MTNQQLVEEFHRRFGHFLGETLQARLPDDVLSLRKRLHEEELSELHAAMDRVDVIGVADGLADCLYVLYGTAVCYRIPLDEVFREVHRSNMTKTGRRSDGKTQKGAGYEPPRIQVVLERAGDGNVPV